jgi:PTS system mannose-specific IID component
MDSGAEERRPHNGIMTDGKERGMTDTPGRVLSRIDLLRVLLRSLLIQASWSIDRMQSFGFGYALLPVLRKLYPDPAAFAARLRLHIEYFNTQPVFASFILGAVAKIEEERAAGRDTGGADAAAIKASLMGPLAALGDSYFWGGLRPLAACFAVAVFLVGAWWAPLLFVLVYNLWHLGLRATLLFSGYASAGDAEQLIVRRHLTRSVRLFKAVSLSLLGGAVGSLAVWRPEVHPPAGIPDALAGAAGLGVTIALLGAFRIGLSPVKLMILLAVLCIGLALTGVV